MDVSSRAHRTIKKLSLFNESMDSVRKHPVLQHGESFIGVYKNPIEKEQIIFSNFGIYVSLEEADSWHNIHYADIVSVDTPDEKNCTELRLNLTGGESIMIPVRGVKEARFFDSFEVLRFLNRVIADLGRG